MKIIKANYEIITPTEEISTAVSRIARIARVCYKSESKSNPDADMKLIRSLIASGHEAMLEHYSFSVKFICDRGISHEIVRHRMASFAQESTRYCNYSKDKFGNELTIINPDFDDDYYEDLWSIAMFHSEDCYLRMLESGCTPEQARAVLPNSIKTEIVMTTNIREWRHFFKLRAAGTTGRPHPQMVELTIPLLNELKEITPFFDDIEVKEQE